MAEESSGGAGMGVIVGVLLAAVVVIGVVLFAGGRFGGSGARSLDVNIHAPNVTAPTPASAPKS